MCLRSSRGSKPHPSPEPLAHSQGITTDYPLGQSDQCPISVPWANKPMPEFWPPDQLLSGDSRLTLLWNRTISTSSTLVAALGPASSLPLEHARRLGQEKIWRTGSCIIARAFFCSLCYLPVSALSVVRASLPGTMGIHPRRRRWTLRTYKRHRSQPPAHKLFGQQTSLPTPRSITEPPLPTEVVRQLIREWLRATR